jgi:hypothetical protein
VPCSYMQLEGSATFKQPASREIDETTVKLLPESVGSLYLKPGG